MKPRRIRPGVFWVGAVDWDRRLFDALIPLPDGTSYNAYLVTGESATALFETVDPSKTETLLAHLDGIERLDYIVLQHAEQDHTGSLTRVLERYPEAKVLCSPKAVELLACHLGLPEAMFTPLQDGEELSLGGRTLRFLHTPWVHWPETMSTYVVEEKVLLSCDLFGSHLATTDLFGDEGEIMPAAKRYFAEIMMPLKAAVKKNLDKLEPLEIDVIAPSHGPAYADPGMIVRAYREWVEGPPKNTVVIPYVTMHGSTLVMVERLADALVERGIKVEREDLASVDFGRLATHLVDAATLVVGTPTVLTQPHPAVTSALSLIESLRPKTRFVSVVASYGWSSKAVETVLGMVEGLKAEAVEPVLVRGLPTSDDLTAVDALAESIAAKHREIGLG